MHDTATEAEELAEFRTKVAAMEAAVAAVVLDARRLVRSGVAERVEGRPLDLLLAADVGMPGVDRYHLLNAADVLQSMPQIADSWAGGRLSWGQVRSICAAVRKRSLEERAVVDARVTACLADRDGDEDLTVRLDAHDPDALLDGVDRLLEELRSRRSVEHAEERNQRRRSFALQPRLDGGVDGRFSYSDPEAASVIGEAIAAHRDRPEADDPTRAPHEPTPDQQSQAEAFLRLCRDSLAGRADGMSRPARPSMVVDVDVEDLEQNLAGSVRVRLRGAPRRITARDLARLAADGADVRVMLTRDGRPLAVTAAAATDRLDEHGVALTDALAALAHLPRRTRRAGLARLLAAVNTALNASSATDRVLAGERPLTDPPLLHAEQVPAAVRLAVTARDKGCRFHSCDAPTAWAEVHHIRWRRHGGLHHVDNLVLLCRRCHRLIHAHGWQLTLHPDGVLTGRRGQRMWTTVPNGTPLRRAGPAPPGPEQPPRRHDPSPHPDNPF